MGGDVDILDIGCGGGGQLARAGAQVSGRLVGIDVSPVACEEAVVRCEPLGPRCSILHSDLFDLDTASLGQFDLIYLTGIYYVVPPAVQRRLRDVIAACLKPGGAVMISYYAPEIWRHFDALRRHIRGADDPSQPPDIRIRSARAAVQEIARTAGQGGIPDRVLNHALSCETATFFHEMLGEVLAPVTALDLEKTLAPAGIHFLNWLAPGPFAHLADAGARAAAADQVPGGGYHYAVFAEGLSVASSWVGVRWQTRFRRAGSSPRGGIAFRDPASGYVIDIAHPATAAALDLLAAAPAPWSTIAAAIAERGQGIHLPVVKSDFLALWQGGLLISLGENGTTY